MEKNRNFPNLLEALFIILVLMAMEWLVCAAFIDIAGRPAADDMLAEVIISLTSFGITIGGLLAFKNLSPAALIHSGKASVPAVLLLLSLPVAMVFVGMCVLMQDLLALLLIALPMSQGQYESFSHMVSGGIWTFVALCLVAPLVEESLFRGILLRSFLHQYSRRQAIVLSSLLFGIAHLNVYQLLAASILGMALAWLYVRTRSLWPCIIGHGVYNFSAYMISTNSLASAGGSGLPGAGWQIAALLAILAGGGMLWSMLGKGAEERAAAPGE